jgi:hypothetical protein
VRYQQVEQHRMPHRTIAKGVSDGAVAVFHAGVAVVI